MKMVAMSLPFAPELALECYSGRMATIETGAGK